MKNAYGLLMMFVIVLSILPLIIQDTGWGIKASTENINRKRVVLFSIDALRSDMVLNLTSQGVLPGFKYVVENGAIAQGMVVSFPSSTAVSHAVISTGAPPGITGITGNSIHLPGTSLTSSVSGFNGSYLLAEPIWVALDRQGLSCVVAAFPQSTPPAWEGKVRRSLLFNPYDTSAPGITPSALYTTNRSIAGATYISISPAVNWSGSLAGVSIINAHETSIKIGDDLWYIYLINSSGARRFDYIAIVPKTKDLSRAVAIMKEGEWSKPINITISYRGREYIVAPLFKFIEGSIDNLRIYRTIARPFEADAPWFNNRTVAWRIWNDVITKTGFLTDGDYYGLNNGWFDEDTFMETVWYTNNFFMEFTRWLIRNTYWDFLMTYTPVVDNVYHQFLGLIDPSMPYYDLGMAQKYWSYIVRTIKWVDEFLQMLINETDIERTAIVVVSDHGQWPVAKLVYINNILEQAGLLKRIGGRIAENESIAWYNGYNQIFINLRGRERGGIVDPDMYDYYVNFILRLLANITDPSTGELIFSVLMKRQEAFGLGLFGERVGDIVVSTKPGYTTPGGFSPTGVPFVNVSPLRTITADHKDLPYYPELYAVFVAVGAGIGKARLGLIHSTSVAPTISAILGADPPRNSTGNILPILATTREVTTVKILTTATMTREMATTVRETIRDTATHTIYITMTRNTQTVYASIDAQGQQWYVIAIGSIMLVLGIAIGYIIRTQSRR